MRLRRVSSKAFTLVELLVSMAILLIIMGILLSITSQTQQILRQTSQRIDAFREARVAFESLTRQISQTTLNTYWDYDIDYTKTPPPPPARYVRRSELRFLSGVNGDGTSLVDNARGAALTSEHPTHSIFFQAPLGFVSNSAYRGLESLLTTWGYFIEISDDSTLRPTFLNSLQPAPAVRTRFRLMELTEPAETLTLYTKSSARPGYNTREWFSTPLAIPADNHVMAENVIALVLLPKLSAREDATGTALAPAYLYSSAPAKWPPAKPQPLTESQLPPLIQVTMVVIDETSAMRLATLSGSTDPSIKLGLDKLFLQTGNLSDAAQPGYAQDLQTLTNTLQSLRLSYRVFSSEVSIRGAKWSAN